MTQMYDVLRNPVVTEKTMSLAENNQYVFDVLPRATKVSIKEAVEKIFNVKVESVQTLNRSGKAKRFKGVPGKRADMRRAVVRLKEGQKLDVLPN